MKTNYYNSYVMSDEMALGFFDADGSVLLGADKRTYPSGKKSLTRIKVAYELNQSPSKRDATEKFAKKEVHCLYLKKRLGCLVTKKSNSAVGKRLCACLMHKNISREITRDSQIS